MALSQNGFPALESGSPKLHKWIIPGTSRHFIMRNGSAGFLLAHFALWWHETIEPIDTGIWDDWGHAWRPVRGQSSGLSNHASGTAIDINATRHVLGRRGTVAKAAQVVARVRWFRGTLRWGGEYRSRADEMHVEINAPLSACEKRARALMGSPRGKRILAANPTQKAVILS